MNATLRQLKTFIVVARRLSFSRAAEELHLTQPAVSEQIKQLEVHVGLPLFEKLGKKIFLTPAGEEMLRYSQEIIDQFRQAEEAMEQIGRPHSRLKVGMITAGAYLFPHLLATFMQRHGDIELDVAVQNRQELLQRVEDHTTDIAIMINAPGHTGLVSMAFAPHPFVIVAAPGHPLAGERKIPVSALSNERFLVREKGSDTWHSMKENLMDRHGKLHAPMEIKSTETIKQAVIAGMGLSFLSAHTVGFEVRAGMLSILDVEGFPIIDSWQVVHRSDKPLAPAALAFKQFLLDEGAAQIARFSHADDSATRSDQADRPADAHITARR